jgi:hypothetical protein
MDVDDFVREFGHEPSACQGASWESYARQYAATLGVPPRREGESWEAAARRLADLVFTRVDGQLAPRNAEEIAADWKARGY